METIQARYEQDDANRQQILDRARLCARLTDPAILPEQNQDPNSKLPENYQSVGSRGIVNLCGKMLVALFPPEFPFFQMLPAPQIRYNPLVPDDKKQELESVLALYELIVQATLESGTVGVRRRHRLSGFRSAMRRMIEQIMVTGDTLGRMTDDYQIIVYRRDQYVTRRDSAGRVLYHIVCEEIDPLTLTNDQFDKSKLNRDELKDKPVHERCRKLFTRCLWEPSTGDEGEWKIEQEVNGNVVNSSTESVSPFISTPYKLAPGDHYGRGFVELNLGDLRSLDVLSEKTLDFAAMCSKLLAFIDGASEITPEDLEKSSGSVVHGARILNGEIQDVAFLKVDKLQDWGVVYQNVTRLRDDLGAAMLIESEIQPQQERVTAEQIRGIQNELNGALGGVYANIADDLQIPILDRCIHLLQKAKELPALPKGSVEIRTLTGIAALGRAFKAQTLAAFVQQVQAFGPEITARLDMNVLLDIMARYQGINEPGLVLTKEQAHQKIKEAMQQQAAMEATSKAIDVTGNVVEHAATQKKGVA